MSDRPPVWQTILADLKRRRVFRIAALYGGIAFAVLEASDLLAAGLGLPQQVQTVITLLVLAGFPVALVLAWTFDLTPGGVQRTEPAAPAELEAIVSEPRRRRWPAGIAALLGLFLIFAAGWIAAGRLGWRPGLPQTAYAVEDPRGSYVVLPFAHRSETPLEAELAAQAAGRVTRQLRGWETVRVVPDFALTGVLYDLGATETTLPTIELGIEVARSQRVGTLIALTAEIDGDSAFIEAMLFDAGLGQSVGQPVVARGLTTDLDHLVAPVTQAVLNLRDHPAELETLRRESPNPRAHMEFQTGLDALYGWRLAAAEEHFREAIASDSSFALPHHYLGLTLYWQTSRNPERIVDLGPEVARLARRAERLAEERDLRPGLREHVSAFRRFWEGDYAGARAAYQAILSRDSTDTEAWLLLGAVEFTDPWLTEVEGDGAVPRSDLNVARRAFETTATGSPDFQISYGHLFDLDRRIADAALGRGCPAFERPGGPTLPPYALREAGAQEAFCPVERDSIQWIAPGSVTAADAERALDGAARTEAYLKRWASIQPAQPRPQEEWAEQLLWRQSLLRCDAGTDVAAGLSAGALQRVGRSLALRGDTTAEDRVRLAVLSLAAGEPVAAVALADDALAELAAASDQEGAALAPGAAANVFLATGRPGRAADLLAPSWALSSFGAEDPRDGSIVFAGPVGEAIGHLRVLGATGALDETANAAFEVLAAEWAEPAYTTRQVALLRQAAMESMGLGPALALDPSARASWFESWDQNDLELPGIWRGFLAADREQEALAREELMTAAGNQDPARDRAQDFYVTGLLADVVDADSVALASYRTAAGCPAAIGSLDHAWGLRPLSLYRAGAAAERLGLASDAADLYEAALDLWFAADPPVSAAADTARIALARLR